MGLSNFDALKVTGDVNAATLTGDVKAQDATTLINSTAKSAAFSGGVAGNIQATPQVISGDGAIAIPAGNGSVFLTKGSAAAITIAAPTAGGPGVGDDGKEITIFSETAFAHVVTCAADGFNAKGSSGTATASAAANNWFRIIARNGHWRIVGNLNFTIA